MNKTILWTTWLNRIIMLLTFSSLSIGLLSTHYEYGIYSLMLAIPLGIFQFFGAVNLCYVIRDKDVKSYKRINRYTNSVGLYFLTCFILYFVVFFLEEFIPFNLDYIGYTLVVIPIILAFFFTYIMESMYREKTSSLE